MPISTKLTTMQWENLKEELRKEEITTDEDPLTRCLFGQKPKDWKDLPAAPKEPTECKRAPMLDRFAPPSLKGVKARSRA